MGMMSLRRRVMSVGDNSVYTFFDWMQASADGNRCFDTGIELNIYDKTYRFTGKFAKSGSLLSVYGSHGLFSIGTRMNDSVCGMGRFADKRITNIIDYRYNSYMSNVPPTGTRADILAGSFYEFVLEGDADIQYGGKLTLNNTAYSYSSSRGNSTNNHLCIFGVNGGQTNYAYPARLSELKVYHGDTLIGDFIPAVRNADSVIGFYDAVSDNFLTYETEGDGTPLVVGNGFNDFTL